MTREQAEAEVQYVLARSIYMGLYKEGIISRKELKQALEDAVQKYKPICGELEVNSIAGEENYTYRSYEKDNQDG